MKIRDIEVGKKIGESAKFRIYLGNTESDYQVLLKVAKTFEDNDALVSESGQFNLLRCFAEQVATYEKYARKKSSHYDWLFARLRASFIEPTQGDRRINVYEVPEISFDKLMPLTKLCAGTEIDARTSVWILGRLFKFYSFFELIAFELNSVAQYPIFNPDNFVIGVERHRLVYYNHSGSIPDVVAYDFVKAISKYILDWAVISKDSEEQEYLELLKDFSENGRKSFEQAHAELYDLAYKLWEIGYHPFTYRDRDTLVWKTIKGE